MKLLKDEVIEKSEGSVSLQVRPVTTSQQARIMAMASKSGIEAQVELTAYALRSLIEKLSVDGVDYVPSDLADRADLSDGETVRAFVTIGNLAVTAAFPSEETEKK